MAEDNIQDKDLITQTPKEEVSSKKEVSPKKKIGGAFSNMLHLIKKPKPKGDKPVGDVKSAPEIKKPPKNKAKNIVQLKVVIPRR